MLHLFILFGIVILVGCFNTSSQALEENVHDSSHIALQDSSSDEQSNSINSSSIGSSTQRYSTYETSSNNSMSLSSSHFSSSNSSMSLSSSYFSDTVLVSSEASTDTSSLINDWQFMLTQQFDTVPVWLDSPNANEPELIACKSFTCDSLAAIDIFEELEFMLSPSKYKVNDAGRIATLDISMKRNEFEISNSAYTLHRNIGKLTELTSLTMNLPFKNWPYEMIHLEKLDTLIITFGQMVKIPEVVFTYENLRYLHLHENGIRFIDPKIAQLNKLEVLIIDSEQILSIPTEVTQLSELHHITLNRLGLTAIPSEMSNLTNLTELTISTPPLLDLPESIGELSQLSTLTITNTQLTTLPASLKQLENLKVLSLGNNKLTQIFDDFSGFTKLENLLISENNLTQFPSGLESLKKLWDINIRSNSISEIPQSFMKNTKLIRLLFYDNFICDVEKDQREWLLTMDLYGFDQQTCFPCDLDPRQEVNTYQYYTEGFLNKNNELSFDYNCDGNSTPIESQVASKECTYMTKEPEYCRNCDVTKFRCNGNSGWENKVPQCGEEGTFVTCKMPSEGFCIQQKYDEVVKCH